MEFHGLARKELQALCKRNKIPANMTNVAMADALAALPQVEGLGEISNPKEGGDIGTPAVQPRTVGRTTTQRKAVKETESSKISSRPNRGGRSGVVEGEFEQENKDANVPDTPAVVPCGRRKAPAVSTRRKKEVIILDEEEEDDKNEVSEKPKDVAAKTPAAVPKSRTRAAGRSVRDKKEVSDGTSLQKAYSTRRSVRVLGKSLSKVSLVETEDMEQTKSEDVSEDGTSLQTESNVVSQNNDEVEASSVNKADCEPQSHDSGSETKSADAEDVLQAEPEVEGSEKVNHVKDANEDPSLNLHDSFETCVDSKEAESEHAELEGSGDAGIENKECFGAEHDQVMEFAAPEEAPLEVADQAIGASTNVVSGDNISMEVADQEEVADLSVEASEEFKGTAEQAIVGLSVDASDVTSKEISHQAIVSSTDEVSRNISMEIADQEDVADLSVEASEEAIHGTAEQAIVGLSVEASDEASKEISHQAIASSTDVVSDDASKEVSDQEDVAGVAAELAIAGLSVKSSEEASKEISHQAISPIDVVVPDDASVDNLDEGVVDMVFEEVEKIEGAVSAILAEKDDTSGRTENEGEKESNDVEKVILKLSMMGVSVKKEADQNNASQKLEVDAQAAELGTEEHTELEDEGEKESNDVEKVILKLSMMDVSAKKEADQNNTSQKLEVEAQAEELAKEENSELEAVVQINDHKTSDIAVESMAFVQEEPICSPQLKTIGVQDMSMRSLKKLLKSGTKEISNEIQAVTNVESDMNKQLLKSGTKEISNEIQASVESDMNNPNTKKENSKTIDVQNMSMRGLKKLLKEKLDGKLAMTDNDDVQMQGVEKKRTALQALPQNQLAEQKNLY